MSKPFVSNVISQKYDTALDFHVTMYDSLPYQRDSDYCNAEKLCLVSGQVIKYYLCLNQPAFFAIDNKDDQIQKILAREAERMKAAPAPHAITAEDSSEESVITPEQIQTLLDDQEELPDIPLSDDMADDVDAPEHAVNTFADVEDW